MVFDGKWITRKGTFTDDNRDYCAVALRSSGALYCVVDGSTQAFQSGELAEIFVKELADRFVAQPAIDNVEDIKYLLRELSESLKTSYPASRLSFLILLDLGGGSVTALYAGDCRLGRIARDGVITWLTRAHTLANAIEEIEDEVLSRHDGRYTLTRNFSPGKLCYMETGWFSLMADDCLVMSTDGYWAGLDDKQKLEFITKRFMPSCRERDDISCLVLVCSLSDGAGVIVSENSENLYIAEICGSG